MLNQEELDRIAAEELSDGVITRSTYCGRCGYNLRALPVRYECPECGNPYDTLSRRKKGIYEGRDAELPFWMLTAVVLLTPIAIVLLIKGAKPFDSSKFAVGCIFLFLAVLIGGQAWWKLSDYLRERSVEKRIEEED